jgi:hypothetical protein
MSPSDDLWVRLARVDARWRLLVESVYYNTDPQHLRRRWSVTLSPKSGEEPGTPIVLEAETLIEALVRGAEAAEAYELARLAEGAKRPEGARSDPGSGSASSTG